MRSIVMENRSCFPHNVHCFGVIFHIQADMNRGNNFIVPVQRIDMNVVGLDDVWETLNVGGDIIKLNPSGVPPRGIAEAAKISRAPK